MLFLTQQNYTIGFALDRSDGSPLYKSIKSSPYRGRRSVKRSEAHLKKIFVCSVRLLLLRLPQSAHFHQPFTFQGASKCRSSGLVPPRPCHRTTCQVFTSFLFTIMITIYKGPTMVCLKKVKDYSIYTCVHSANRSVPYKCLP